MAVGRHIDQEKMIMRAPLWGPQSFTRRLLLADVLAWTRGERAAELSVIPKRTHTYFGAYKPGSAQRIPPVINTGYGPDYVSSERVRTSLVARARMFRSALQLNQGDVDAIDASHADAGLDAARSQARIVGRA